MLMTILDAIPEGTKKVIFRGRNEIVFSLVVDTLVTTAGTLWSISGAPFPSHFKCFSLEMQTQLAYSKRQKELFSLQEQYPVIAYSKRK